MVLNTELMKSVTVKSKDPQVVEYVVQPNAVWEDGKPIGCSDFYLNWLAQNGKAVSTEIDPETNKPKPIFDTNSTSGYDQVSKLECSPDGKTITLTFSKPYADYKGMFQGTSMMVPAHILEAKTGIADITKVNETSPQDVLKKVGDFWNTGFDGFDPTVAISGAWYKLTSFNKGQDLTLERNEKYYGPPGKLDTIVFKQVPDATQEPTALGNNDVQVIYPQVNPDVIANLNKIADASTSVNFGTNWEHLDFSFRNPILKDKAVRQAFLLGVDVQEIVNKEIGPVTDQGTPLGNRWLLTNQTGFQDNRKTSTLDFSKPDPDKAKQVLEDAGWKAGTDGIRVKDGQKLSIKIGRRDPNPRRHSIIETVASQLRPIGFDIVEAADPTFNATLLPAGNYEIALFGYTGSPFLSNGYDSVYRTGSGGNFQGYSNPEVDKLLDSLAVEFDPQKQKDIANQIDQKLWEDASSLPLFQSPDILSFRKNVKNVVYNGAQGPTWNAFDWALS